MTRALLALLLLAGCTTAPTEVAAPIRTDRTTYAFRNGPQGPELTVTATLRAPADRAIYITNCNGASTQGLQRKVGARWETAFVAATNACLSPPIVLQPGQEHTARLFVHEHAGAIVHPRGARELEPGTYRVVWFNVYTSFDANARPFGPELPLAQRVSAPITITRVTAAAPPSTPPLPSTPPPAPPERIVASTHVLGQVLNARGNPVAHAQVLVRSADASCRPIGPEVGAATDERGEYLGIAEARDAQPYRGCVVVEARSGGATGSVSAPVDFTTESPRVRVDVRLDRRVPLTLGEAERLVGLLASAIDQPVRTSAELPLYVNDGPEALRVALESYLPLLQDVTAVRAVPSEPFDPRRFTFELQGANGRTMRVDVHQEELTRLHSPLLDYGYRAHGFMTAYLRAISSGDAVRLAQVLTADDVDFPVEEAREMIVSYRRRYRDTATIRAELVNVDEQRNTMTWRLHGPGPGESGEVTETIVLGFGDGLIGIRR